jgi:hypothetical protein
MEYRKLISLDTNAKAELVNKAIEKAGSQTKLAAIILKPQSQISIWRKGAIGFKCLVLLIDYLENTQS